MSSAEAGPCTRLPVLIALFLVLQTNNRAVAMPVEVSQAPQKHLELIIRAIKSATESLHINIYELKSEEIAEAVLERIHAGIHVEILNEGQPVGGMTEAAGEIRHQLVTA